MTVHAAHPRGSRSQPQRRIADRLEELWFATAWILRLEAGGVDFVLRPRAPSGSLPQGPAIAGLIGSDRFALVLPDDLVAATLARAPEPIGWNALAPADAALVLECLLGDALGALETRLGLPISLESVIPAMGATDEAALTFEIMTPGAIHPCAAFLHGREPRGRMAQDLLRIVGWGPAVMPGQLLVVGPVDLDDAELADLQPGDTIMLDGAATDFLDGAILYDDGSARPVTIQGGAATLADAEMASAAQMQRVGAVDLLIGSVRAPVMAEPGAVAPFRSFEDGRVRLRRFGAVIALGELVETDGRIGLSISSVEADR
ncbi:hypothetical protein GCM10007036_43660 [Alsobacter metallidurans]|uniref:Uncharacterized protein n=1 Tax=Alsobacter metallidurans TaxID=340221 RepID=A0A917IAX8_9HYPH|nr:hypothetical protein [Alsobacter metallidurans]GGH32054.1 hypothetical protein GCM10007036_43660 [Alsobacter metallidurans]